MFSRINRPGRDLAHPAVHGAGRYATSFPQNREFTLRLKYTPRVCLHHSISLGEQTSLPRLASRSLYGAGTSGSKT